MKKYIHFLLVALAALVLFASCSFKEKEATFTYCCAYFGNLQDNERAAALKTYMDAACDGYFAAKHSFFGYADDANTRACNEFAAKCELVSEDAVLSFLEPGEQVYVYLMNDETGMLLMYCLWAKPDPEESSEE